MKNAIIYIAIFLSGRLAFCQSKPIGIDTTEIINVGGIKQVFSIKGKDVTKPVLLYLHGASGSDYSLIGNADKLTSKLQKHFVVVLWDQREYGKTFQLNKSPEPLTVGLLVNDTKEVVDYFLKTFNRKKLYIAAHSMGCVMGIYMAQEYPERLYALIEMSPPVNGIASQKIGLAMLKKHFKKKHNDRAIRELATIKLPARDFESLFTKYVWQTEYDGEHISDTLRAKIKPMMKQWMETSAASLSNEVFEMNFLKQFLSLQCPVYFFVGRKDYMTNATVCEKYYKKLKAPKKQLFWFEKSAHGIPDSEPELMQEIIITKILPETQY
ncbi:Pimeloyl-ACP methyl ester carboxylesterase [Mucilaginibacter sp. OK268]|uniref:alpha/beta fold hydrolase n=1 Tax=Mucilaginibacter sp. OK268 TaxID=1881048 RepID=UPI00088F1E06|nr:alpha/beta hydrolase [Mucilaginibacter sp. OK268]SDQ01713.1 Pimeloyl-ACP methyl ester carboxylesterase [Mucilaginibacter sp. OK268]